ncbi:MAG: polyprenyl synthetase family protein [Lachnospiraceae bacterium]|nr:polyprenyl synthetase family protein [Lachnospiraceae bacterium]
MNNPIKDKNAEINSIIYRYLPKSDKYTELITDAMNYSVQAGGKRIRPIFMQEAYKLFTDQEETETLHRFMAAMEYVHTYSLCHDDLPAMDNDQYRRGNLTTHAKFGEAFGILAGDGLLNYAFEVISEYMANNLDYSELKKATKAFNILTTKAGYKGMVGGQTLDVYFDKNKMFDQKQEQINFIYNNKTAALIEASFMIGAILGGASEEEVQIMEKVANNVGMAFQIKDDLLDITSTQEVLGKPINSDEKNGKKTLVSFLGMEEAERLVEQLSKDAIEQLHLIGKRNETLEQIIHLLINRDN